MLYNQRAYSHISNSKRIWKVVSLDEYGYSVFETSYYLFSDVKLYGCLYQEMFNFHRLNTQWEPISTDLDMVLYFYMYWEQENFMKNFLYFLCILSMAEKKGNSQPRIYHVYHINISDTVTAFKISHSSYFLVTTRQ